MISLLSFYGVYIGKTLFPPLEVVGRYPSVKAVQQVILEHMMEKRDMNPVFVMNDLLGNTTNFALYVISSILYFLICHLLLVSFLLLILVNTEMDICSGISQQIVYELGLRNHSNK